MTKQQALEHAEYEAARANYEQASTKLRRNCVDADCYNGAMIDRYDLALKWIVDQSDNEDADLDDIILRAKRALEGR